MKEAFSLLIVVSLIIGPSFAWAKKSDCKSDGEYLDQTKEGGSELKDKLHFSDNSYEYFIGLSTQEPKLSVAKELAIQAARKSILDNLAQMIQRHNQTISQLDGNELNDVIGTLSAPTIIRTLNTDEWYYEKWASYSNCKPEYYYNGWVAAKISKEELQSEREKLIIYNVF